MEYRVNRLTRISLMAAALYIIAAGFSTTFAYNEAPMLAAKVNAGKLPPVDSRLPPSPVVVQPVEKIGQYGGTWRRAYTGLADLVGVRRILYDPLVRWSPDYKVIPNLAEKWDVSEDGRVFTFHLVKGVRWSDGEPFTADDILFYFEDIISDKELTSSVPKWLCPTDSCPKVTKIDDFTIRIEFDRPYGLFLEQLAGPDGMALVSKPKHYLKKFHKKYADPQQLEALMKQRSASTWVRLFQDASDIRSAQFVNTELPTLCAWMTTVPAPARRFTMERNPYYWKVDPAGNQLPYIDSIVHELQAESQTILLKAIAGEIDFQGRNLGGMQNSVLLLANLDQGKYKLVPKISTASVGLLVAPNINHRDPLVREVFADPRFRKALSHAINRTEINKLVYRGKGVPRQAAPLKESPFYSASYEKAHLQYDPAKAISLLDEMGLAVNKKGKRMLRDNRPLQVSIDVMVTNQTWVDTAEIVASNLKRIGIDTEIKSETMELFRQRTQAGEHDLALWPGDGGMECLLVPRWYFPYSSESLYAPSYGQWFQSDGKKGEEPPESIKKQMETYTSILRTVSRDKVKELFSKIIAADEENLWVLGLVHEPPDYYVVAKNMFNVPAEDFQSWIYPNPGPIHPEQFFFMRAN